MLNRPAKVARCAIVLALLLASCSTNQSADNSGPSPSPAPGAPAPAPASAPGTPVPATLVVTLTGTPPSPAAGTMPPASAAPSWSGVEGIFQSRCTSCHGQGGRLPGLYQYPFAMQPGATLPGTLADIAAKINDAAQPMPPSGQLAAGELQALNAWLASGATMGAPATAPAPQAGNAGSATGLALAADWATSASTAVMGAPLTPQADGSYTLALGQLAVGSYVTVRLHVDDATGRQLGTLSPAPAAVSGTGTVVISGTVP